MTTTRIDSPVNQKLSAAAQARWLELLAAATRQGFFGSVAVEAVVQDGTIQRLQSKVERIEK